MSAVGFTDSIEGNLELLKELISGLPPSARPRALRAAVMLENTVNAIKKDEGSDAATGLGMAFGVLMIAKQLLESDNEGERKGLIQLLS